MVSFVILVLKGLRNRMKELLVFVWLYVMLMDVVNVRTVRYVMLVLLKE